MRARTLGWMLAGAMAFGAQARTPDWLAVPGAAELQVHAGSLDQHNGLVTARVRLAGSTRLMRGAAFEPVGRLGAHHRRVVSLQFDCMRRTVRLLDTQTFDARDRPLSMDATPGPVVPLPGDESAGWLYDAVCELARARAQ